MSYTIEQVEDAVITALTPTKTSLGVRTVETYQADLDFTDKEIRRKLARLLPATYIVYGGSRYTAHGDRKVEAMTFSIFVCDKSLREEGEARRGGTQNPGTYAMLRANRDLLFARQLSLEIAPLNLKREVPVWIGNGISVYAADYETAQSLLYTGT